MYLNWLLKLVPQTPFAIVAISIGVVNTVFQIMFAIYCRCKSHDNVGRAHQKQKGAIGVKKTVKRSW